MRGRSPGPGADEELPVDPRRLGEAPCDGARPPGRPRSAEADEAILAATVELLSEEGYAGTSMEAVAARAGVSKATLYRRWPGKAELVTDTLGAVVDKVPVPDSGDVATDLRALAASMSQALGDTPLGRVGAGLSGEFARNPELAQVFRQRFLAPRRQLVRQVLQRGIDRGELRPDLDLELVLDMVAGTLYYRSHVSGGAVTGTTADALVDLVLAGLAPR